MRRSMLVLVSLALSGCRTTAQAVSPSVAMATRSVVDAEVNRAGVTVQLGCITRREMPDGSSKREEAPCRSRLGALALELGTPWGASLVSQLDADERATFAIDWPNVPVAEAQVTPQALRDGWTVTLAGREIAWTPGEEVLAEVVDGIVSGGENLAAAPTPEVPEVPEVPAPSRRLVRYGVQTAVADVLVPLLTFVGVVVAIHVDLETQPDFDDRPSPHPVTNVTGGAGVLGYFLAAPLVHLRHHNWAGAGRSLLLRLAGPVLGACAALLDHEGVAAAVTVTGLVAAPFVDAIWNAKVWVRDTRPATTAYAAPLSGGGATVGLAGSF